MQTTEMYDEALDKALYALDNLCDELDGLDDMQERIERLLDTESGGSIEKRLSSVKERLIELGTTIVEPLTDYLYDPDSCGSIIAADVLGEIGISSAVPALIDALETDSEGLCECASEALVKIGTPAVQPLIDRINDRLDNPEIDEYGHKIGTIYAIDALSMIQDQRSFYFMVELLDRFEGDDEYLLNLEHLCGCFQDQRNPEIIPRLRAIAEEYRNDSGDFIHISTEAEHSITRLETDQVIQSEDWTIYGCCRICRNYDHGEEVCLISGGYEARDTFCFECEPGDAFDCEVCQTDDCDIYNLPLVYTDIRYRLDQEESVDEFAITNMRSDSDTGSIRIANDFMELILDSTTVDILSELKEFLKGDGDSLSTGVSFLIGCDEVGGTLVRNGDCTVAVCDEPEPWSELELKLDSGIINALIQIIDTQRFLLLCDSYRRLDDFREWQKDADSRVRESMEAGETAVTEPVPECDHEFELLKEHKKYTVYKCRRCGETRKEF
ncbi:MAG TPA: HEAT repeat domain-containing protein [Methanosarcinales archaeon]|nr:HEAT repeat domain-containing protein [Methanosarcinales archaeon]